MHSVGKTRNVRAGRSRCTPERGRDTPNTDHGRTTLLKSRLLLTDIRVMEKYHTSASSCQRHNAGKRHRKEEQTPRECRSFPYTHHRLLKYQYIYIYIAREKKKDVYKDVTRRRRQIPGHPRISLFYATGMHGKQIYIWPYMCQKMSQVELCSRAQKSIFFQSALSKIKWRGDPPTKTITEVRKTGQIGREIQYGKELLSAKENGPEAENAKHGADIAAAFSSGRFVVWRISSLRCDQLSSRSPKWPR